MPSPTDQIAVEGGGLVGNQTSLALVRGSLLDALLSSGLLPSGTLTQAAPPTDTSLFWIDSATNPRTLKRHNGTAWVAATFEDVYQKSLTSQLASQTILTDGNFTVPADVFSVRVTVKAGGGGGSGGSGNSNMHGNTVIGGGGGGEGGISIGTYAVTPGDVIAVLIGAGGVGGNHNATGDSVGTTGGSSSFGALASATGGGGSRNTAGGVGGLGLGGDVLLHGMNGMHAFHRGAQSMFDGGAGGNGARRRLLNTTGVADSGFDANANTGGGGGGASIGGTAPAGIKGGDGSDGYVFIEWVN